MDFARNQGSPSCLDHHQNGGSGNSPLYYAPSADVIRFRCRDYGVLERALASGAREQCLMAAFGFGFSANFAVADL
jgi:hypothetical protein